MKDLECCKVKLKLKPYEEIIDVKSSFSYKEKCHIFVFRTNLNRDFAIEIEEYRK